MNTTAATLVRIIRESLEERFPIQCGQEQVEETKERLFVRIPVLGSVATQEVTLEVEASTLGCHVVVGYLYHKPNFTGGPECREFSAFCTQGTVGFEVARAMRKVCEELGTPNDPFSLNRTRPGL